MTAQAGDTLLQDSAASAKAALRRLLRERRSAIPHHERAASARKAARLLLARLPARSRVAIYLSVRSELSTLPLCAALLRAGHQVHAPITLREQRMRFLRLTRHTPLRRCAMGLPQPVAPRSVCPVRRLDLILLPLLGFDAEGTRLGNGGGYYDRVLAKPRVGRRPRYIGYAYAAQEVEHIPSERFDVRLDAVITERGLRRLGRPRH